MSAEVSIRFVGMEEAARVRELMLAAFREYDTVLSVPSSAMWETVDDTAAHIADGGAVLADVDGLTVGSGRFEMREDHVYIGRLSVLPEHRGRGIGALMMTAMEQHAAGQGSPEARISVRTLLPKNIELYERLGYVATDRYKHARGDEIIVDMAKKLA
ncbi:MAG: GNAT family N-acetyltransferase [bacterium]